MAGTKLVGTTHDLDLFANPDGRGHAWNGSTLVGSVWPSKTRPGSWWSQIGDKPAALCGSQHLAWAHIVGRCPDFSCNPHRCDEDESGDSCMDCGSCMHGCPEAECDMTVINKEANAR